MSSTQAMWAEGGVLGPGWESAREPGPETRRHTPVPVRALALPVTMSVLRPSRVLDALDHSLPSCRHRSANRSIFERPAGPSPAQGKTHESQHDRVRDAAGFYLSERTASAGTHSVERRKRPFARIQRAAGRWRNSGACWTICQCRLRTPSRFLESRERLTIEAFQPIYSEGPSTCCRSSSRRRQNASGLRTLARMACPGRLGLSDCCPAHRLR